MHREPSINRACEECKRYVRLLNFRNRKLGFSDKGSKAKRNETSSSTDDADTLRKKIRCDGRRPQCILCSRSGVDCIYTRRKLRTQARPRNAAWEQAYGNSSIDLGLSRCPLYVFNKRHTVLMAAIQDQNQSSRSSRQSEVQQTTPEPSAPSFSPQRQSGPAISDIDLISPTDQDIIDFLTETIPDVWHTEGDAGLEACQSYSILPDGYGTNISQAMSESEAGYPLLPSENGSRHTLLQTEVTTQQMMHQSASIPGQKERYSLEVPKAIVDHLYSFPDRASI
jgi:hypothetical protein